MALTEFRFETKEVVEGVNLPEKYIRSALLKFQDAKLINLVYTLNSFDCVSEALLIDSSEVNLEIE